MARQKRNTREVIIKAARDSFERFGYKRTVIDDIVREAGIAKGTFYLHFESKEQLFLDVLRQIREEMMVEFREVLESEKTSEGKVRKTLLWIFDAFEKHPIFAKITIGDEEFRFFLDLIDDEDLKRETYAILLFFRTIFEEGIKNGEFREDLDLDLVPLVLGSLKFMHFFKKEIAAFSTYGEDEVIRTLVDIAVRGIMNPARSGAGKVEGKEH